MLKLKPSKKPSTQLEDSAWATQTLKHFEVLVQRNGNREHELIFTKNGSDIEIVIPKKDLPGLSHCHCGNLAHTGRCGRFHFYQKIIKPFVNEANDGRATQNDERANRE